MQYDHILVFIGSFGKWQKLIFLYVSIIAIANALLTMQQSFILYKPDFRSVLDLKCCRNGPNVHTYRCKVPICDGNATEFDAPHATFTIPFWDQEGLNDDMKEIRSCQAYSLKQNAIECEENSFTDSHQGYTLSTIQPTKYNSNAFSHSSVPRGTHFLQ
jgi:hypothetical protein